MRAVGMTVEEGAEAVRHVSHCLEEPVQHRTMKPVLQKRISERIAHR